MAAENSSTARQDARTTPLADDPYPGVRDIIVIGGSAGGIEAASTILADISPDVNAAIFVVIHTGEAAPGLMADIFAKRSVLPVQYASDREPIELGSVYVAPPDRHLLVKRGEMRVIRGPKENNFRPALDPLFRTAATTYDGRVIGVVLSGSMDDGTHGLLQIKRAGGVAVVQSPEDALHPDMPQSAIDRMEVDHVLAVSEIAPLLSRLSSGGGETAASMRDDQVDVSEGIVGALRLGGTAPPSPFICPECKGALWEARDGDVVKYRCHVGHGFATDTLLSLQAIEIEQALWSAVRGFEERAELQRRTAERIDVRNGGLRARFLENSREQQRMADVVRALLVGPEHIETEEIGKSFRHEYAG
jgi:two-component system chemotaxis response regulator CheB